MQVNCFDDYNEQWRPGVSQVEKYEFWCYFYSFVKKKKKNYKKTYNPKDKRRHTEKLALSHYVGLQTSVDARRD